MLPLLSLIRREFTAYFLSPIAYVVAAAFFFFVGIEFRNTLTLMSEAGLSGTEYPMQTLLGDQVFWLVFLFIPPVLTMRLLAEERGTGTIEMLMTAPIREWQIVAGKFIGCFLFYLALWLPTLAYIPVVTNMTWNPVHFGVDPWPVLTSSIGIILSGAMFLSIGLLMSSLVKTQLVAAIISLVVSLVFTAAAFIRPNYDEITIWVKIAYYVSVPEHFRQDFCRGIINTQNIVLYVSVTAFCLYLTVRSLEARRR